MTVVFTDQEDVAAGVTSDIVGFFTFKDFLSAADGEASGNESDLLWLRVPQDGAGIPLAVGTLAHEYTHLASYALRVHARNSMALRESLWLDEGLGPPDGGSHRLGCFQHWCGNHRPFRLGR